MEDIIRYVPNLPRIFSNGHKKKTGGQSNCQVETENDNEKLGWGEREPLKEKSGETLKNGAEAFFIG